MIDRVKAHLCIKSFGLALYFAPVLWLLVLRISSGSFIGYSVASWISIFLSFCVVHLITFPFIKLENIEESSQRPFDLSLLVFFFVFVLTYGLVLHWSDFFPLGERLRDYAVLSEVIKNPVSPEEPWLSGFSISYYIYWYRFGAFIKYALNLSVANTYHFLVAFAPSLAVASIFYLFRKYLKFSKFSSILSGVLIVFSSNIAGVLFGISGLLGKSDTNWWGPSRVVEGAINEYPAWSFALGDAHPHFLNLASVTLFLLFIIPIFNTKKRLISNIELIIFSFLGFLGTSIFFTTANPWDTPMWLCLAVFLLSAKLVFDTRVLKLKLLDRDNFTLSKNEIVIIAFISFIVILNFYSSLVPVIASDQKIGFVGGKVSNTRISELFLHWGLPLSATILAAILSFKDSIARIAIVLTLSLAISLFDCPALLVVLILLMSLKITKLLNSNTSGIDIFFYTVGLTSLILILVPEILFLDDPYGGKHERMNTIFKVYSFVWVPFHIFAIFAYTKFFNKLFSNKALFSVGALGVLILLSSATIKLVFTEGLRNNPQRANFFDVEGLSTVEREFPGSKNAIEFLRTQPDGIVIEADGNPYSWTSFVGTLANKSQYLGWANHVELLLKQYQEVASRRENIKRIYTLNNCDEKKQLLNAAGISYLVLGDLERRKFSINEASYSCLNKVHSSKGYQIYSTRSHR